MYVVRYIQNIHIVQNYVYVLKINSCNFLCIMHNTVLRSSKPAHKVFQLSDPVYCTYLGNWNSYSLRLQFHGEVCFPEKACIVPCSRALFWDHRRRIQISFALVSNIEWCNKLSWHFWRWMTKKNIGTVEVLDFHLFDIGVCLKILSIQSAVIWCLSVQINRRSERCFNFCCYCIQEFDRF